MKVTTVTAFVLVIIGAIVWGLVGIFDFNVVAAIFGAGEEEKCVCYLKLKDGSRMKMLCSPTLEYHHRTMTYDDILAAIELALMEQAAPAAPDKMPELDRALETRVWQPLDEAIHKSLASVSLDDILTAIDAEKDASSLMYFI